jgi:hypothetical protein
MLEAKRRKSIMRYSKLLIALLLLLPHAAYSYEKAEELLWACSGEEGQGAEAVLMALHCRGYVVGVLDGAQLVFGLHPESRLFCPPAGGMSGDQQLRIVTKYLEDNPADLHESARISILIAYTEAFPCK